MCIVKNEQKINLDKNTQFTPTVVGFKNCCARKLFIY